MSPDVQQTILDISASIEALKNRMPTMDKATRARAEKTCNHLHRRIEELHAPVAPRRGRRVRAG